MTWFCLLLAAALAFTPAASQGQIPAVGRPPGSGLLDDIELLDIRSRQVIAMGPVTPETVEGFEILYATPGSRDVSEVAGHLLLRVKLNNHPSAKAIGLENPHDLVLSFLADTERGKPVITNRFQVVREDCRQKNWFNLVAHRAEGERPLESIWQSIKGLAGGFFMVMDRQTLEQAIKHYTVEQDRSLLRYELLLSPRQKEDLIAYLHEIKSTYRQRYYFFSMNCGSALVRVLGEGIDEEAVAGFAPMVSPPHSLVALLVRRGLARRVFPSFHSTTAKGYMARLLFAQEYQTLVAEYPDPAWLAGAQYFVADEASRAQAVRTLHDMAKVNDPGLSQQLFRLAALVQEAEMVYDDKQRACEDYTSEATAEARRIQAFILQETQDARLLRIDVDSWVVDSFLPVEQSGAETGSLYTGLNRWTFGGGYYDLNGKGEGTLHLSMILLAQDMGSSSRMAMQRGGSLALGSFGLVAAGGDVLEWQATGLHMRKFRDTLDRVESSFRSTRGLGLGLRALDTTHDRAMNRTRCSVFGAEVLANVFSSAHYSRHLFLFAGANADYMRYQNHENMTISPLLGAEALVTLDQAMRWQWRTSFAYSFATRDENSDEYHVRSSLRCRLGELGKQEVSLGFAVDYRFTGRSDQYLEQQERTAVRVELVMSRW